MEKRKKKDIKEIITWNENLGERRVLYIIMQLWFIHLIELTEKGAHVIPIYFFDCILKRLSDVSKFHTQNTFAHTQSQIGYILESLFEY